MPDALQRAKTDIRMHMVDQRARMHADARDAASAGIVARIAAADAFRAADVFCSYAPLQEEVYVEPLVAMAVQQGCRVYLPGFDDVARFYRFREWDPAVPLRTGHWNILEPAGEGFAVPTGTICMVVPGLAFDRCGRRIGYGGGYFDRMLAEVRRVPGNAVTVIGVAYAFQVLADVPSGALDEPVDFVVTESEWIKTEK